MIISHSARCCSSGLHSGQRLRGEDHPEVEGTSANLRDHHPVRGTQGSSLRDFFFWVMLKLRSTTLCRKMFILIYLYHFVFLAWECMRLPTQQRRIMKRDYELNPLFVRSLICLEAFSAEFSSSGSPQDKTESSSSVLHLTWGGPKGQTAFHRRPQIKEKQDSSQK